MKFHIKIYIDFIDFNEKYNDYYKEESEYNNELKTISDNSSISNLNNKKIVNLKKNNNNNK